jgi:4-alpha-glucanotransferase
MVNNKHLKSSLCQKDLNDYKNTIKDALKLLDKDNLGLIIHGGSFPASNDTDTGFGSPYSSDALEFMQFINDLGFNCIQLGPSGKTKMVEPSPYTSTIFSDNPLFIDLYELTTNEWANILDVEMFHDIVKSNKKRNQSKINYEYAYEKYDMALRKAWNNFKNPESLSSDQKTQINLKKEQFENFKDKAKSWLDNDSLYEVLTKVYDNDYWPVWEGPQSNLDKNLISMLNSDIPSEKEKALARKTELEALEEYEFFKFCQFILYDQKNRISKKSPVSTIADIQVTYSDRDVWAYQNLFLDDYKLGVPPDMFSQCGQTWGFPVINPDLLFEKDPEGNIIKENGLPKLGPAGRLIKIRFDKELSENPGGVRIDHIIGLIDPWIYPEKAKSAKASAGGKRIFSSPEAEEPFKSWAKVPVEAIDEEMNPEKEHKVILEEIDKEAIGRYASIIDIIIQSAKDNNVAFSNIICEDLGSLTNPTIAVLEDRKLSGMRVTQFVDPEDEDHIYRVKNTDPQHWVTPGTHDNDTLISWINSISKEYEKHLDYLKEDLKLNIDNIKDFESARTLLLKAKLAELFASPARNVQVMFMDVFGMQERYNNPGASTEENKNNWVLRLPNNYKEYYFEQLSKDLGLNLAEALLIAIRSKDDEFVNTHEELIKKLEHFADRFKSCLMQTG